MECVGLTPSCVFNKIKELLCETIIGWVVLTIRYGRNVENLKNETADLKVKMNDMKAKMDEAKRRGDQILEGVQKDWEELEKTSNDAQQMVSDATNNKWGCWRSFECLVVRCRKSNEAVQLRESVVNSKMEKIKLDNIAFRPRLPGNFENKDYKTFETREEVVDQIMEALGDDSVGKIGLHGMPGVGKTTLVQEIAKKALEKDQRLFDDAVIVTVSQTPNLEKIQQKIAERLGLKFTKELIEERGIELRNRMKDEKNFLIVLDDVWSKLDIEKAGIVFESTIGCKILISSRFKRVLGSDEETTTSTSVADMGISSKFIFKVELLTKDEAVNWFNDIVGDAAKDPEFQEIGNKIANKCDGLAIAIVTVASSLKNRLLSIWEDVLGRLERSGHDKPVFSAIESCYEILESQEAKKLLLLCALHEEDQNIRLEDLMIYGFGVKMFKGVHTLQEARNRVDCCVDLLKDRCLLLDGDYSETVKIHDGIFAQSGDYSKTVKMHDVICDYAKSIPKESHDMHSFRDGREVEDFLGEQNLEDLKEIMLPNGYLNELVSRKLENTWLQLIICRKCESWEFPVDGFLNRTTELRVLDFEGVPTSRGDFLEYPKFLASSLPTIFQNIRTLRLKGFELEGVAKIKLLKNLEILVLYRCKITKIPVEIGKLTSLRMLDLRNCDSLDVIEPNVILNLRRLEELYVDSFQNWHTFDGVGNHIWETRNATLAEINRLDGLTALHLKVPHVKMLVDVLINTQKLKSFVIEIGYCTFYRHLELSHSRQLRINHTESSLLWYHGIQMLMKKAQVLLLEGLNGVKSMVDELDTNGFLELQIFELRKNCTIEYLVNHSMGQIHVHNVFGRLEELILHDLSNLKQICHGEVTIESFKSLKVVEIKNCNGLKKLLLPTVPKLERIEIVDCKEMEEIFAYQIQHHTDCDDNVEFYQLQHLILVGVPKFKEFCSKISKEDEPLVEDLDVPMFNGKFLCFPKLEELQLWGCGMKKIWDDHLLQGLSTSFSCLTTLKVSECMYLKSLVPSSMAVSFKQLISLVVENCEAMQEIVCGDEMMDKILFPKLHSLYLGNLPRLSKFSSIIFIDFPILDRLEIKNCSQLKTLFVSKSSSEEKSNTSMPCLFNQNVAFPSLKTISIVDMDDLKMIWQYGCYTDNNVDSICKLENVEVENCKNLERIFSYGLHKRLRNLKTLKIEGCKMVKEICEMETPKSSSGTEKVVDKDEEGFDDEFLFPQLQKLILTRLPNLVSFYARTNALRFPRLEKLEVKDWLEEKALSGSEVVMRHQGRHKSLFPAKVTLGIEKCSIILHDLPEMMQIMEEQEEESSQQQPQTPVSSYLIDLRVSRCQGLKKLVPSFISAQNLHILSVTRCNGMRHLLSSQTAKSMTQLFKLDIRGCERMESIISDEGGVDSMGGGEIVFTVLNYLLLYDLRSLSSFYSGNCTIGFPNLKTLLVNRCYNMHNFSKHSILSHPKLELKIDGDVLKLESEAESGLSSNMMLDINSFMAQRRKSISIT